MGIFLVQRLAIFTAALLTCFIIYLSTRNGQLDLIAAEEKLAYYLAGTNADSIQFTVDSCHQKNQVW